jgi:ABC-type lipoprotein export system ATPase subunit
MSDAVTLVLEPGRDKAGRPEACGTLTFAAGQVVAIVGPTGSGKTRLLSDLERLSPGDSPTARKVRLSGVPQARIDAGFAVGRISQTMQFFLDLTVTEFVAMHREARGAGSDVTGEAPGVAVMAAANALAGDAAIARGDAGISADDDAVIAAANTLAGEPMAADQPLAALSGGQARALMVADLVLVADAPVLLIDEIENAGIDRHAALDFLVKRNRLVFLATHDPLIALRADLRLALGEGGIRQVLETTAGERDVAVRLEAADREVRDLRERLRRGDSLA